MSVNSLTFEQSAAFLTDLYEEATGQQLTTQISDTGTFTSVGTTLLQQGYDPIINAISVVLTKSIFSERPYSMHFKAINVDAEKWGAIVRKINYIDKPLDETDESMSLTDGESIDQYVVKKPEVLQTNFYGKTLYSDHVTVFTYQLDSALNNASEFGRFMAGVMQNMENKLTQISEAEARGILANFITGKKVSDSDNVINVLQAYYDETGTELTPATMYNKENFAPFVRWFYAWVNTLTDFMGERCENYHVNLTGKPIMRHTPPSFMRAYMSSNMLNKTASEVLAVTFNEEKLKMIEWEKVAFWQNIRNPYEVKATPSYFDPTDGKVVKATDPVTVSNILGVLFDEEALGLTESERSVDASPYNASGKYYNLFWHKCQQTWNDFTENGVVLYAGTVTTNKSKKN